METRSLNDDDESAGEPKANCRMYLAICTVMLGAAMFGFDMGNFGNVQGFRDFIDEWCVGRFGDEAECAGNGDAGRAWHNFLGQCNLLMPIGMALGALLLGPFLTERRGRRFCISLSAALACAGSLMSSFLSLGSLPMFLLGRLTTGFGVGACCIALPMYNSEISTPSVRGRTSALMELNTMTGIFVATVITLYDQNWRRGMFLPGVVGAVVAIAVWFTPESPRYLLRKKGVEACTEALESVRCGDVTAEVRAIREQVEAEAKVGQVAFRELFSKPNVRRRVCIACVMNICQQMTGYNIFLEYAFTLFSQAGMGSPFQINALITGTGVLGVVVGLTLMDSKYGGRRRLLLIATVLVGVPLFLSAACIFWQVTPVATIVLFCIMSFGNELAWGPVPWIYPSEIFSMAEKDRAVSLAAFCQYATQCMLMVVGPSLIDWSVAGMCVLFGVVNVFSYAFVHLCVRETQGIPLESTPALFD